jgi:WD40 repeat protein
MIQDYFWFLCSAVRLSKFTGDKVRMISGSDDRTLKLWDVASEDVVRTYDQHEVLLSHCVHFVFNGICFAGLCAVRSCEPSRASHDVVVAGELRNTCSYSIPLLVQSLLPLKVIDTYQEYLILLISPHSPLYMMQELNLSNVRYFHSSLAYLDKSNWNSCPVLKTRTTYGAYVTMDHQGPGCMSEGESKWRTGRYRAISQASDGGT